MERMDKEAQRTLLKMTVLIKEYDNSFTTHLTSSTAFFCKGEKEKLYLVTCYHVIRDSDNFSVLLSLHDKSKEHEIYEDVCFTINKSDSNNVKICAEYDVCAVDFTAIYDNLVSQEKYPNIGFVPFHGITTEYTDFNYIEEIITIGYPSGVINESINHPIVKIGHTATSLCELLNNKLKFIIDIYSVPGSSGSPIFCVDSNNGKLKLVGILTDTYNSIVNIFQNNSNNIIGQIKIPNGLGIATKASVISLLLKYTA